MKNLVILIPIIISTYFIASCSSQSVEKNVPKEKINDQSIPDSTHYLASDYQWNYVWAWAMNLAWNELWDTVFHQNPQLQTDDKVALDMVEKLNNPVLTKDDLDERSYYVKSWFWQETVDTINRETREKFPSKSFGDLNIQLGPKDIMTYAYFLKEVAYKEPFKDGGLEFNGQRVQAFYAGTVEQKNNVSIINYENDDKFIIHIQLKDNSDRLILAKGYNMMNPWSILSDISLYARSYYPKMDNIDSFFAPKLNLDYSRNYIELKDKFFSNEEFNQSSIREMFENIKFTMDESGARVEYEAGMAQPTPVPDIDEIKKEKHLHLNKPYWVIMQRTDSNKPYFILGINNEKLMEKQ